jgi:hypothetical protein
MTDPQDVALWRNRFILIQLTRIGGTILVLIALLFWQSDVFIAGGTPFAIPFVFAGLVISFWGPKHLARKWRTPREP